MQTNQPILKDAGYANRLFRPNDRSVYFLIVAIQYFAITLIASNSAIFYLSHGITKAWLGYLGTIGAITILIFEFPTGLVADRFGNGISVSISFILRGLATLMAAISYGPLMFCFVTLLGSLGATFFSGAAESWVFKRDKSIKKNMANFFANSFIFNGTARVIGGGGGTLLASIRPDVPFFLSGLLLIMIAILFTVYNSSLKDNELIKPSKENTASPKDLIKDAKKTFKIVFNDKSLFYITFCGVFFIIFCNIPLLYWQPFFYESAERINVLGGVWVGFISLNMLGNYASKKKIIKQITDGYLLSFLIIMCGLSLLVSALVKNYIYGSIAGFFCYQFFLGILGPVRGRIINQQIKDEKRASVLSLISLLENAGSVFSMSLIGYLCNFYDLKWIFIFSTIPLIAALLFAVKIQSIKT